MRWTATLAPEAPFTATAPGTVVEVAVVTGSGVVVTWRSRADTAGEPWVAQAPPAPSEIAGAGELFATATHLSQYRHPTRSPIPYLREALERDASDARAATALAAWHLRRGEYDDAAALLERALARETRRNLNPRDGEAHYLFALVRERQGCLAAADELFARAAWNVAWAAPSHLARARIALRDGRPADALRLAADAGAIPEAQRVAVLARRALRLDDGWTELHAADPLDVATAALGPAMPSLVDPRTLLDVAAEFARAGAYDHALLVTDGPLAPAIGSAEPLRRVLRAAWRDAVRDPRASDELADLGPLDLAFPAGLDLLDALDSAVRIADGPEVRALRGMWMLDTARDDDALADLRAATDGGIRDAVAWRNLALAIMRTSGDTAAADTAYVRALGISADARLVFERDLLARLAGVTASVRLRMLEEHADLLATRDDLALAHVTLLLDAGRVDDAWAILTSRVFRPFEGGEGQVIAAFDRAACALARRLEPFDAAALLRDGFVAPRNLGEGRHPAVPQAERLVLLGDALEALGDSVAAADAWCAARAGTPLAVAERPAEVGDRWIGVAHLRLGERAEAEALWRRLEGRADELERAKDEVDYFATSLPELLVFDIDTAAARVATAAALRAAAAEGRMDA